MALGNQFWREGICFQGDSPAPRLISSRRRPHPRLVGGGYISELCQQSVLGGVLVMRTPLDCRHLGHSVNSSSSSMKQGRDPVTSQDEQYLTCQIPAPVHQVPLPTVRQVAVGICILNVPPSMACVVKAWCLAHVPLGQGGRTLRRWSLLEGSLGCWGPAFEQGISESLPPPLSLRPSHGSPLSY